ncbi:MAG: CopG family transcriptional regulator [Prochloraceae cyanobacterium]|nr:CopG family transcriptional regulator [Prochloraceae cyanobacterium]
MTSKSQYKMPKETVRTTLTLPLDLIERADKAVKEGFAKSRNELVAKALADLLAAVEREKIDRAFREMKDDREYKEEAKAIEKEFTGASWEALQLGEQEV